MPNPPRKVRIIRGRYTGHVGDLTDTTTYQETVHLHTVILDDTIRNWPLLVTDRDIEDVTTNHLNTWRHHRREHELNAAMEWVPADE